MKAIFIAAAIGLTLGATAASASQTRDTHQQSASAASQPGDEQVAWNDDDSGQTNRYKPHWRNHSGS